MITGKRLAAVIAVLILLSGCTGGKKTEKVRSEKPEAAAVKHAGESNGKASGTGKPSPAVEAPDRPKLTVVSTGVTLSWDEAGKTKMQASASEIVGNEMTGSGIMKNAKVLWYDNGQLTTVMTAPRIDTEQKTRILIASGGVTVRSIPRKTVIKAQWLKWFTKEHKVIGNGGVSVTSDVVTINAGGLVADTELKALKFTSGGSGGAASFKP